MPEGVAANIRGRSYKIIADVDITHGRPRRASSRTARASAATALFIKDGKLHYVYNFLGIKPEQQFVSGPLTPGQTHTWHGVHAREARVSTVSPSARASFTSMTRPVAKGPMRAQVGKFTLSGDGLCVGFDSGDNVSSQYQNPGTFTGGTIQVVFIDVSEKAFIDLQREAAGALEPD